MPGLAEPKRGLRYGVYPRAGLLLSIVQVSLIFYGQAPIKFDLYYYKPFLKYAFNIGGPILEAWSGWPIIRTAPQL
jgi:hypothetical protein